MSDPDDGDGPGDDPHFFLVGGRRWRRTDPGIPERLRVELVQELMSARRAVRDGAGDPDAVAAARRRVQDAKVALGERGEPWWEEPSPDGLGRRLGAVIRTLLRHREPESTICPSDAARVVAGDGFRAVMDASRAAAGGLRGEGVVVTTQRGEEVDPAEATGPLRIGRGPRWEQNA